MQRATSESGMTLIETLVAMCVLSIGAIGMASVFLYGMAAATSAPNELIATQKAAEAIESVYSARDSHTITWAQLTNASDGGIFLDSETEMFTAGADGILNTADDSAAGVETVHLPGDDGQVGTPDDEEVPLLGFKRRIAIADFCDPAPTPPDVCRVRQVIVVITYPAGATTRTYTLTALISAFA